MKKTFKKHKLPMKIIAKDEMECLIKGLDWLITKIPQEIFTYDLTELTTKFEPIQSKKEIYPYLLVNIGSGVSMVKVTKPGPEGFERIGGSSLGGGTLWGLLSLLTDAKDYNEMLEMAQNGDNENIDLLVGDIYGTNYNKIGLKANHIASSFAKVFKKLRKSTRLRTAITITIPIMIVMVNLKNWLLLKNWLNLNKKILLDLYYFLYLIILVKLLIYMH